MTFKSMENNPLPELVELYAAVSEISLNAFELRTTLLINPEEIDVGDFSLQVDLLEAHVSVDAFGCTVDPNSKYGKRVHPQSVPRTVVTERSYKVAVSTTDAREAAAELSLSMVDTAVRAGGKRSRSGELSTDVSLSERQEQTSEHFPVEAVGNNRWKVSEDGGDPLRGYYLNDVQLCRFSKSPDPTNRLGASVSVEVAKRNILITIVKDRRVFRTPQNKEKLLAILIAKRLAKVTAASNERAITFSVVEVEDEG